MSKRQQVKQRCHDMSCGMVWLRRMLTQILNPIPSCEHVNACKYRYVYNEMKSAAWSCSKNTYVQSKLHNHQKTCMENACFFFNSGADRHFGLVLIYPEIRGSGRRKTIDYVYAAGDDGGCGGGGGDCFFLALYHPNLPKTISWW